MINRPFSIIGVQQIAVGSDNKSALKHLWVDLLGLDFLGTYKSEAENVDEDICSIGQSDIAIEVDLMQPLDKSRSPPSCETNAITSLIRLSGPTNSG